MKTNQLLLARIKSIGIERDEIASDRDRLLLEQKFILKTYTDWLISNNYIITGKNEIDHIARFRKSLNKLKTKLK